jgi:hypothetical protein
MSNYWRFGLVLLIAVVACSDKKAEQATALKTEIEGLLAKAAGPDKKNFSYGDVAVTPGDGNAYNVTIDKLTMPLPDAQPLDLGKVGFRLTPDGDDMRKFSDLTIPQSLKVKDGTGKDLGTVNLVLDHGNGRWSKNLGVLLDIDLLIKTLDVTQDSSGDSASALKIAYQVVSTDTGNGVYDQKGTFGAKQLVVAGKDGNMTANDITATSGIDGLKLAEFIALQAEWKKALESQKPDQMLPVAAKIVSLMRSIRGEFSVGQISATDASHQPLFSLGGFGFHFGAEGLDQPKSKLTTGLRWVGLAVPELTQMAGPAGAELVPADFGIKLSMDDVPVPVAIDLASKSMGETNMSDQGALMGASMMVAGALEQALVQAGTKIKITDGKLTAPAVTGMFTGEALADKAAAMGATGSLDILLSDLDAVIAKISAHSEDPSAQQIVGVLQTMKGLSDRRTDSAGKPTDHFKVTLDAQGTTLVNGAPFNPGP